MLDNFISKYTSDPEAMLYWQINNEQGIMRCIIICMAVYLVTSIVIIAFCRWRGRDTLVMGFVPGLNLALPILTILGDIFSAIGNSMEESKAKSEERKREKEAEKARLKAEKEAEKANSDIVQESSSDDAEFDIF